MTFLGIELGSTRIKAVLVDNGCAVLASGSHTWENQLVDGLWSYPLDEVWTGIQGAFADLSGDFESRTGVAPEIDGIGISAMMHGYLAFDAADQLLVPFRTWRNTNTAEAAEALTDALGVNIPQRWSIAHLYQAALGGEPHVPQVAFLTTLAGYVHWQLTGEKVLGVGDASGMFPVQFPVVGEPATGPGVAAEPTRWSSERVQEADQPPRQSLRDCHPSPEGNLPWSTSLFGSEGAAAEPGEFPSLGGVAAEPTGWSKATWDAARLATAQQLLDARHAGVNLTAVLPKILMAGQSAGCLTDAGAMLLDPTGALKPGIPLCPPEGDAGTGMVATNAVAPRTGNVSAGTSIFAMVVLERPLKSLHTEIDLVTTPSGDPVAMVHCNNGASEIDAWAGVFSQFAARLGAPTEDTFEILFNAALDGEADGGGLLAYNYLAGEPVTGLAQGRPLIVRAPGSRLDLPNFSRTLIMSSFATLALGMRTLADEGVGVDAMFAHGGVFKTKGVAQRLLAAALDTAVTVGETASEGGAWGMAVLAAYAAQGDGASLADYLARRVFAGLNTTTMTPDAADVAGFKAFLAGFEAGIVVERAATTLWDEEEPA